jgi:predicted amidohydrolase
VDGLGIAYNGHSVLLDYQAKPLIGFADNEAGVKTYQIDKSLIDKFRQKFAFWKDADEFEIK